MQQGPVGHHAIAPHLQHRGSAEGRPRSTYAGNGNGAMPIPQGPPSQLYNGASRNGNGMPAAQPFDVARSPPNPAAKSALFFLNHYAQAAKLCIDTKHVPCKFFRQGTCQAGAACPFLHSTDTAIETAPCKYFTKVHRKIITCPWVCEYTDMNMHRATASSVPNVLLPTYYQMEEE